MKIVNTFRGHSIPVINYIEWSVHEEYFDYSLAKLGVRTSYPRIQKIDANKVQRNETPIYV